MFDTEQAEKRRVSTHLLPRDQQLPAESVDSATNNSISNQPSQAEQEQRQEDEEAEESESESEDVNADADEDENRRFDEKMNSSRQSAASAPSPLLTSTTKRRVVIVAKQLPLRTTRDSDGKWTIEWEDTRNFLSALSSLPVHHSNIDIKWVGSPNSNVDIKKDEEDEYEDLLYDYNCIPVFLPASLSNRFFNGFCKGVLWPMLHYVMPQSNQHFGEMWDDLWQAYTAANTLYSSVVCHAVETPTDMIWIQNYHLLLLPSFLRTKLPRAKIGLFIHTPFPSSDVFRLLPTRQNILSSMMATDLLGFHTFDYARHFLSCIKRVMDLEFESLPGGALGVKYNGRFVSIVISHVGIDSQGFLDRVNSPQVAARVEEIKRLFPERQLVVGADDFDPVKGPLLKLQAFHHFLRTHSIWRSKMTFVQFLLPSSSQDVALRQSLLNEIALIQSEFGEDSMYVIEVKTSDEMKMEEMIAWYRASQVCVVSTFFDGLNLMPYEYSVCQQMQNPGVLVISEFMGCSRSLIGVLRVNPWSLEAVSDAIEHALTLPLEDRKAMHIRRYNYVVSHTTERWGLGFLEQLEKATRWGGELNFVQVGWGSNVKLMGLRSDFAHLEDDIITSAYRKASKRVLLLDYDGTLTPLSSSSTQSRLIGPSATLKKILRAIISDPDNCVFIMTGRTRSVLTEWFSDLPELGLAAEKGLFLRWPARFQATCRMDTFEGNSPNEEKEQMLSASASATLPPNTVNSSQILRDDSLLHVRESEWECLIPLDDVTWKDTALTLILSYTEQTDGSWVEIKEFALVWHYENADPEYGRMQASELAKYLVKILANPTVDVVRYDYARLLEVKPHGIGKGVATNAILESLFLKANIMRVSSHASLMSLSDGSAIAAPFSPLASHPVSGVVVGVSGNTVAASHHTRTNSSSFSSSSSFSNSNSSGGGPNPNALNSLSTSAPVSPLPSPGLTAALSPPSSPFLLCVGDDRSDEEMFQAVNNKEYLAGRVRGLGLMPLSPINRQSSSQIPAQNSTVTITIPDHHSQSKHPRNPAGTNPAKTNAYEEEKWGEDASAPSKLRSPPDPFTFSVCVGMKPSNAHYFLHDDEEVLKMLLSLATCSTRMAQSRVLDQKNLSELVRQGSVNTLASLLLPTGGGSAVSLGNNRMITGGAGSGIQGGSSGNLAALLASGTQVISPHRSNSGERLVAMSPLHAQTGTGTGTGTGAGTGTGTTGFRGNNQPPIAIGSKNHLVGGRRSGFSGVEEKEEEEEDDDAPAAEEEVEYASASDEEGAAVEY